MKQILPICLFCFIALHLNAQNLAGSYNVTGYLFHPTASRALNLTKTVTQISTNTYQVELGDLGGNNFLFQFTLDTSNNLTNWTAVGATPLPPASGFMTLDNPGNFTFLPASTPPGTSPWVHSTYNNKYNPGTSTFYMHYGYLGGSTGQNGWSRQIYEKWVFAPVITGPHISSASTLSGGFFTQVDLHGTNFTGIDPTYGITFGNATSDSAVIVNDSLIKTWIGNGASGKIKVSNANGSDSLAGFTYTPVPPIATPQWEYLGTAGFSTNRAFNVHAALDKANVPYVVFIDSTTRKAMVKKYISNSWTSVGPDVSDGKCSYSRIILDTAKNPVVAFIDSTNSNRITVKKFIGGTWTNLTMPAATGNFSIALDTLNRIYILYSETNLVKLLEYDGTNWYGTPNIGSTTYRNFDITINRLTNKPWIIYDNASFSMQATVKQYTDSGWMVVGSPAITNAVNGVFYTTIKIGNNGVPVIALQDDNGFERASAFKFSGGNWSPIISPKFSQSHSYHVNLALDKFNNPFIAFWDKSYNQKGTVMTVINARSAWDTVGPRGVMPFAQLDQNALMIDSTNTAIIAFADQSNGGRASVMKLNTTCYNGVNTWTGAVNNQWENPGNWSCGIVPIPTNDVIVNAGAAVILNQSTTVNSFAVSPGSTITVNAPNTLTIIIQ
jgi:hypothetical protein